MSENDRDREPRRLLLGFDGSDEAEDGAALCGVLAPADAKVAVVDVLPSPGAPASAFRLLDTAEFEPPEDFFEPATSRLPGREVETLTYLGDSPARIFENLAAEAGISLIVIGSPHHSGIGRLLAGSVAEALLHGSPVPVATAPHGYSDSDHEAPKAIAVAYDGGPEARAALAYAGALAPELGARLDVLTVERPVDPVGGAIALTMSLPENIDEIQRQALHEVDPSLDLRRRKLTGDTAEAIAAACDDVDLLVVGSRGYGTVERVLIGSTSTALVRESKVPVIVVPRPTEHPKKPRPATGIVVGDETETEPAA